MEKTADKVRTLMNTPEEMKAIMREKSGKKLVAFSVIVFLLITAIVFFAVFGLCGMVRLNQMDEYLGEIPSIVESCRNELRMRSRAYEDDILARAELGLMIYNEESGLTDAERLERVRGAVSAESVSLVDEQNEQLSTTGPVCPAETYRACVQALEPRAPHLELYPKEGETAEGNDGKGFVRIPVSGNRQRSLVFEFPCDGVLELYNALDDWSAVLARMLSGRDAAAFARTGDKLTGYPLDGYTDDQTVQLYDELGKVFQNSGKFWNAGNGRSVKIIKLLGRRYLAMLTHYSEADTDILLTVPVKKVLGNGIYIAAAISIIIGWGIVLLQIYVFRKLQQNKPGEAGEPVSRKWVWQATRPGIVVMLAVTILFSGMLLTLENRTNATFTAMSKRMGVQYEIDMRKSQESAIRSTFVDNYRSRAQMLADFLTEHPDYQTREGLEALNRIAGTDYLMRFDSAGQELVSSNSYTGFSTETNLGDYQAVVMGYPYAVVGPAADPYTGRMQLGTAILMTDGAGQPDGFLLAVYNAGDLNSELKRMSYENAVNGFVVQEGHIAAAIDNEDGRFIAHTDPEMIGQRSKDCLAAVEPGSSFEGFTEYKGTSVCVSAIAEDGRTLLFMVPERGNIYAQGKTTLMALAVLLILALLYYPIASVLVARAMEEAEGKLQPNDRVESSMRVFSDGYSVFLTLFAIFALIASYNGWWTSFDYVFSGRWSKGVHLFSIWAVLFIVAATFCFKFMIRTALSRLESRLGLQTRTIARLANSLIIYTTNLFLFFCVLGMFGVNTTALLASAGVVSIAVGMGAQSLAADLLAGFFMMMEGSVRVGDLVNVAGATGHVTDMGIRTTEITDEKGDVVTVRNSEVKTVRNMSRNQKEPDDEQGNNTGKES